MKTKILALLMVIAALISLTACSEKSNNNITDNPSAESNVGSTDEANNTVKDEQKAFKVGFVCPEATNEGWQVTAAAIEDTAKELNIEVSKLYLDPSDYEGSFALAVDTFIQQKVDAIITAAQTSRMQLRFTRRRKKESSASRSTTRRMREICGTSLLILMLRRQLLVNGWQKNLTRVLF